MKRGLVVWTSLVASSVALGLGLIQSSIWNGSTAPALARMAGGLVPSVASLSSPASKMFVAPDVYFAFGRWFVMVYALVALSVARHPLFGVGARRAALLLLAGAAVADVGVYWLSAIVGAAFREAVFWRVEVPALAVLIVVISAQGVVSVRRNEGARGWALALAAPAAVVATALLRYMPHGPLAALAGALALAAWGAAPSDSVVRASRAVVAGLVLLLASIGGLLWAASYRPRIVRGDVPAPALGTSLRCEGLRLHVFNTGFNRMAPALVGANPPWRPVPAFAIERPRGGVIVFDTGLSHDVALRGEAALPWPMRWLITSRGATDRTLDAQLREAALGPVSDVVVSHFHEDHLGTVDEIHATVWAGAPRGGWRVATPDPWGDGCVTLVPGGGHAREDLMALLALPEGPVLLTGDAVVHFAWLESDDVERIAVEPERAATVRNQVRRFAAASPTNAVFPGHDLSRAPTHRRDVVLHHPEWFDAPGPTIGATSASTTSE